MQDQNQNRQNSESEQRSDSKPTTNETWQTPNGNIPFPYPFQTTPRPRPDYRVLDGIFAWISIVVGYLTVQAFPIVQNTLGGMLCVWLLFAFSALYLVRSKLVLSRSAILFVAASGILSLGLITGANHMIQRLLFTALTFFLLYFIYASCGLAGKHFFGDRTVLHAFQAVLVLPLESVAHIFHALPIRSKQGAGRVLRTVGWTVLGFAVAIIPTTVIVLLLSYDESFKSLLEQIFSFSPKNIGEILLDLILAFVIAILLFGSLFGAKQKRIELAEGENTLDVPNTHILPKALLCAAVTPILAVYVIFFISQADWYLSAFTGVLPADLTYAAYARNGFFELCWVCALNAVFLLLFNLLIRRKEGERGILRAIYSALLSVCTLVLIATALAKMCLYINSYGLTQKRVWTSWFMLLLAALFIAVLVAQFTKRIRLVAVLLVICIVFFGLLVLVDIDGMIADYNVDAYLSGKLDRVDVETLESYGVSSVPALCRLERTLGERDSMTEADALLLTDVQQALERMETVLSEMGNSFFSFNLPTVRAKAAMNARTADS
ncbi:MAG: DUF4173 domain-containing protein [Ruminococcaceae bacterium]|nr:DUF4173 domain-containing protein [Oscillospiraceae bacterium]